MRRMRIKRSLQKFSNAFAEMAIPAMPRLIAAIYRGWLKHKHIEKIINMPTIFALGSRRCIQVFLSR
jgi:hypothetical protein